SMSMRRAPASRLFSTSSLTTDAGRSMTSPAAIWLTSWGDRAWMRMDGNPESGPHSSSRDGMARRSERVSVQFRGLSAVQPSKLGSTGVPPRRTELAPLLLQDFGCASADQAALAPSVDLVAHAGRVLEFEVLGVLVHARLELAELARDLRGTEVRVIRASLGDARTPGGAAATAAFAVRVRTRALHDVGDLPGHAGRGDAVFPVVFDLLVAAPIGLVDRGLHRARHAIRVQDRLAAQVAGRAADGLDQRTGRTQETFFVRVEDRDQRHLGHVEALAQQVDADQHVEVAEAQVTQDLDAFDGLDVRVQVAHAHAMFLEVFGQVLGHALGQGRDQHAVAERDARVRL